MKDKVRLLDKLLMILLFDFVINKWKKLINAPSNSVPPSVLIVIGLKLFHNMFSLTLVAINNEIPDPKPLMIIINILIPYPF